MHKTCKKIMAILFIIIALVLAVLVSSPNKEAHLNLAIAISRFFDVMIPILAVGALIKYLIGCGGCSCKQDDKCACGKDNCTCKQDACKQESCECK